MILRPSLLPLTRPKGELFVGPPYVAPTAGKMMFASPGAAWFPTYPSASAYAPPSGREAFATETFVNALPAGWRAFWANFHTDVDGIAPAERMPGNSNDLRYASLFSAPNVYSAALTFSGQQGATMPDGGFVISDPVTQPALDGWRIRFAMLTPVGGKRPAGYPISVLAEGQRGAAFANVATFDAVRTSGNMTSVGTAVGSNEAVQTAGILKPFAVGDRSVLIIGTSIERGQSGDMQRVLANPRYSYGYIPMGLEDVTGSPRWGHLNLAVYGASLAQQDDPAIGGGEIGRRYALLEAIRQINGGAWPMTDIILGPTNDWIAVADQGGPEATAAVMWAIYKAEMAAFQRLFPGIRIHAITVPPRRVATDAYFATDLVNQVAVDGTTAAFKLANDLVRAGAVAAGFASVLDAGASFAAPDDGSGILKWRITPFNAAGGGTIDTVAHPTGLASGTNLSTAGVTLAAAQAPEIGTYLVFEPGSANSELAGGNWPITSVTAAGSGSWLVKTPISTTTTKAHAAGTVVKTTATLDRTHPCHWLHGIVAAERVAAWKVAA